MRSLTEILENKPGSSDKEIIRQYRTRHSKEFQPIYQSFTYSEVFEDDYGNSFNALVTYNYYDCEDVGFGFCKRVVEYSIQTLQPFKMTEDSMEVSLRESIRFHAGGTVVFEVDKANKSLM